MADERYRAMATRVFRYGIVGGIGTAIYFGLTLLLNHGGLILPIAHWLGYGVSIVFSYYAQKKYTFQMDGQHRRAGPRFVIATAGIAAGQFLIVLILDRFGLAPWMTVAAASVYYPFASFTVHSLWTFRV